MRSYLWIALGPVLLRFFVNLTGLDAPLAAQLALPEKLVSFEAQEGQEMLSSSERANFESLQRAFLPQPHPMYCGPTSAAIVVNAIRLAKDPYSERVSSEWFFGNRVAEVVKSQAAVQGKIPGKSGKIDPGFSLDEFTEAFRRHGFEIVKHEMSPELSFDAIRQELVAAVSTRGKYVIVNYSRAALGEKGGGHFSPLAAYNRKADMFLVLDVNPKKYPWTWIKTHDLILAMKTRDGERYRGYVTIGAEAPVREMKP